MTPSDKAEEFLQSLGHSITKVDRNWYCNNCCNTFIFNAINLIYGTTAPLKCYYITIIKSGMVVQYTTAYETDEDPKKIYSTCTCKDLVVQDIIR